MTTMVYNQSTTLPISKGRGRLAWLLLFACLLLSPASDRLFAQGGSQRLQIDYRDRMLDISAREVDIKEFFARLAEKANIVIEYPDSLEKKITLERENVSLRRFLANFLRNMNHVIIYSGSGSGGGRVAEVHVYPESTARRTSVSTPTGGSQDRIRRRIESYKRIVEKMQGTLSSVGESSSRGQVYVNRIRRYEERIRNLERELY